MPPMNELILIRLPPASSRLVSFDVFRLVGAFLRVGSKGT